jgi:hypothetical protein
MISNMQKNRAACHRAAAELIEQVGIDDAFVAKVGRRNFILAEYAGEIIKVLVKTKKAGDWQCSLDERPDGADLYILVDDTQITLEFYSIPPTDMLRLIQEGHARYMAIENKARGKRKDHRTINDASRHFRIQIEHVQPFKGWLSALNALEAKIQEALV